MADNSPNLERDLDVQVHEVYISRNKTVLKRFSQRHIRIKLSKIKDKILNAARQKKNCNVQGDSHMALSDFPRRNVTGQERVEWYIQSTEKKKKQKQKP